LSGVLVVRGCVIGGLLIMLDAACSCQGGEDEGRHHVLLGIAVHLRVCA